MENKNYDVDCIKRITGTTSFESSAIDMTLWGIHECDIYGDKNIVAHEEQVCFGNRSTIKNVIVKCTCCENERIIIKDVYIKKESISHVLSS